MNNIRSLVRIMDWRRPGDKPLSEPVMITLLTLIYSTSMGRYCVHQAMMTLMITN